MTAERDTRRMMTRNETIFLYAFRACINALVFSKGKGIILGVRMYNSYMNEIGTKLNESNIDQYAIIVLPFMNLNSLGGLTGLKGQKCRGKKFSLTHSPLGVSEVRKTQIFFNVPRRS